MTIALLYYAVGLLWIVSGLVTGWLHWEGHPLALAIWVVTAAAVWPLLLGLMIWDVTHGRPHTDLQ